MPRKRPSALRGARSNTGSVWSKYVPEPISGLSFATSLAIFCVEQTFFDHYVVVGSTGRALTRYRASAGLRGPFDPPPVECPCGRCSYEASAEHERDVLERVLERLPARAKAELRRVVWRLDAR